MCADRKQTLNAPAAIVAVLFTLSGAALAGPVEAGPGERGDQARMSQGGGAGGVVVGEGTGGVTDRAFVTAPPHYLYVVEKERGSFLDCGEGRETRAADADGRDMAPLRCGVTLTETVVIPAAASSAKLIVHF
ncbi:MAG: hypothetical protein AAFW81_00645 [Pseudomonadota bacterium]